MMERDYGDGRIWYVVAAHYPSALMARRAWERAESKLNTKAGDEGIGITRLAPYRGKSVLKSGAPENVHSVVAITLDRRTARKAERLLRDGTHWKPEKAFADALIARRARIVVMHAQLGSGRLRIRRPENQGAQLFEGGELHEPEPGQG